MKVLILSCGTGGGHNAAAKAIVEELNNHNVQADFKEYLEIINPRVSNVVNELYIKSTGGKGRIFKNVYKIGELYDKTKLTSPVYTLNSLSKKRLYSYIKDNNYDYVATTHLFPAQALTSIKKENNDMHFIEICTDYTYIPFWKETDPDYIIVPHKDLIKEFIDKGMQKSKIKAIGIPVAPEFSNKMPKEECYNTLNLDKSKKYVLIMTGSMGFGSTLEIVENLSKKIKEIIIVICGNNKKLQEQLQKKYTEDKVIAVGFTNQISKYMRISQVLLTKPGGLTTTEAATINIPIIHTMPIPGCENHNAQFFEERGMSKSCTRIKEICSQTQKILENPSARSKMIKKQKKYIDKNTCNKICNIIIQEIKKVGSVKQ